MMIVHHAMNETLFNRRAYGAKMDGRGGIGDAGGIRQARSSLGLFNAESWIGVLGSSRSRSSAGSRTKPHLKRRSLDQGQP
jgi:hypothetical protein